MDWPRVDFGRPDVIMDVANVCHDPALSGGPPVDLARIGVLADAWREYTKSPKQKFALVADRSLLNNLSQAHARVLETAVSEGHIRLASHADPVFLDLAHQSGAKVLSADWFSDLRRTYPWIQGDESTFFTWRCAQGRVVIAQRSMGVLHDYDISRHEEKKERKTRKNFTNPAEYGAWICKDAKCHTEVTDPEAMVCTKCGGVILCTDYTTKDIGLVVEYRGTELAREVLAPGQHLVIGRSEVQHLTDHEISLSQEDIAAISQRHVALENTGGTLEATDLGSTNRTRLLTWDHKREVSYRNALLQPNRPTPLRPKEAVLLADRVAVRRSGRSYPRPGIRVGLSREMSPTVGGLTTVPSPVSPQARSKQSGAT